MIQHQESAIGELVSLTTSIMGCVMCVKRCPANSKNFRFQSIEVSRPLQSTVYEPKLQIVYLRHSAFDIGLSNLSTVAHMEATFSNISSRHNLKESSYNDYSLPTYRNDPSKFNVDNSGCASVQNRTNFLSCGQIQRSANGGAPPDKQKWANNSSTLWSTINGVSIQVLNIFESDRRQDQFGQLVIYQTNDHCCGTNHFHRLYWVKLTESVNGVDNVGNECNATDRLIIDIAR